MKSTGNSSVSGSLFPELTDAQRIWNELTRIEKYGQWMLMGGMEAR
jgi:hypothetical protein